MFHSRVCPLDQPPMAVKDLRKPYLLRFCHPRLQDRNLLSFTCLNTNIHQSLVTYEIVKPNDDNVTGKPIQFFIPKKIIFASAFSNAALRTAWPSLSKEIAVPFADQNFWSGLFCEMYS